MKVFNFKEYVRTILQENLEEGGYWGQGSDTQGAISFHGTYYGFGGDKQLATEPDPSVKKLKKQTDMEMPQNIEDQMKVNSGYPAPEVSSGFPGGQSKSGIQSGVRIPNTLNRIAFSADELDKLNVEDPKKQYWGFDDSDEKTKELDEQLGATGIGAQRGAASDQNYRDVMGFPRHNTIVKSVDYVPDIEGDKNGDGEEDVYLSDEEYVRDVLRLNGIGIQPGQLKRIMMGDLEEGYHPEPDKGIERYKQGLWLDTPTADLDPTKYIMKYVDHSAGHAGLDAAENSPGAQTYGQIGFPKDFVPEDWEQRSEQTKVDDDMKITTENDLKKMINSIVGETLVAKKNKINNEVYTGIDDETGKGPSKGGSKAFEKNRKEIIALDKKYRPRGVEDLGEE